MGQVLSRKRSASANITAHKSDDVTANSNGDVVKAEANGSAIQSTGIESKVEVTETDAAPVKEKKKRRRFFFSLKRTRPGSGRKKKAKKDRNGQVNADTSGNSSKSGLFMDEFQIPEDDGIDSVSLSSNEEKDNKKRKDSGVAIRRSKRNSNSKNGKKKKKKSEKKKEEKSKKKKNSKDEGKSNVVVAAADGSLNISKSVEPLHESVEAATDEAKVLALSEENGTQVLTSDNAVEEDLVAAVTAVMDSNVSEGKMEAEPSAEEIVAPTTATEVASAPSTEKVSVTEEGRERALKTIVESSAQEEIIQSVEATVQEAAPSTETSDGVAPSSSVAEVDQQPVSPVVSNAGDNGVLKRVSLGPRLKTAILKKYSGAGDAPPETRVTLTKPKIVEVTDLVPPPRKNRPRRTLSQTASTTSSSDLNTSSSLSPSSPQTDDDTTVVPEKSDVGSVVAQTLQASSDLKTNVSSDVDPSASTMDKGKDTEVSSSERLDVGSVVAQTLLSSCDLNTNASSDVDPSASTMDKGKDTEVSSSERLDVGSVVAQTLLSSCDLNTNASSDVDPSASTIDKGKDTEVSSSERLDVESVVAQTLLSSYDLNTNASSDVDPSASTMDKDKDTEVSSSERLDVESVVAQTLLSSCDLNTNASSDVDPSASTIDKDKDTTVTSLEQLDGESIVAQTVEASDLNTNVSSDIDSSATATDKDTANTVEKSGIEPTVEQELQSSSECSSHVDPPSLRADEDIQGISQGKTESGLTSTVVNIVESQITSAPDIEVTGGDGSTVNVALGSVLNADTQCVITETVLAPLEASVTLVENEDESPVKAIPLSDAEYRDGAGSEVVPSTTLADQTETAVDDMGTNTASLCFEPTPKEEPSVDTSVTEQVTSRERAEVVEESVASQSEGMVESVQPDALKEECILNDIEIYVEPTKTFETEPEKPDTNTEPVIVIERIHTEPYYGPLPGSEDGQNDDTGSDGVADVTDATKQKFSRETGEVCKECVCEDEVPMNADEEIAEVTEVDEVAIVVEKVMKVSSETESALSDHQCVSATAETPTEERQEESSTNKDSTGLHAEDHDESSSTTTDSTIVDEDEHDRTIVEEKNVAKEPENEHASNERKPAICNGDSNGLTHESGSDSSSSVTTETSRGQEECTDTAVAHEGDRKVVVDCNDEHIETLVGKVNSEHDSSSQSDRDLSDNNNSKIIISSEQENIIETIQKVSDPVNLVLSDNYTSTAAAETVAGE
ncbi:serine-rich adhesin for platelets-like isoform X2 [Haliotis rubra]|uniref:serine-rich adhesin for platelets-like isoform X2 n=1 Tax=Haliotis rubra TaxID=36100 RepID=UPI001EE52A22|nr:serine-rich adhesin for platelets-like isoform X2 [Haliotis rubra]